MKILLMSHESDIDGLGSVVLAKIAFKELDYKLYPDLNALDIDFRNLYHSQKLSEYDKIIITDLALKQSSLDLINEDDTLKDKVVILDHHQASIDLGLSLYPFTKIVVSESGIKTCGTKLFYNYLIENKLIKASSILDIFVEYTRLEDTWEWKNSIDGVDAHNLAVLLNKIGVSNYIEGMYNKLISSNSFEYNSKEISLINEQKKEYENNLMDLWSKTLILTDEFNNKFGIVLADYNYRNEYAEFVKNLSDNKDIKYVVIVALDKGNGQKSYRSIDKDFDVNEVAKYYGGGGHKSAASVNISASQRKKLDTLKYEEKLKYIVFTKFSK